MPFAVISQGHSLVIVLSWGNSKFFNIPQSLALNLVRGTPLFIHNNQLNHKKLNLYAFNAAFSTVLVEEFVFTDVLNTL